MPASCAVGTSGAKRTRSFADTASARRAPEFTCGMRTPAVMKLAGNIQASFITAGVLIPHVNSGALRALAVSANERVRFAPDVPTAQEAGITGFEARFVNYM